ncbi:MAG: STAS domain-containing protein [Firmicutes bacterium]|nr:STAS domain-containing protein [Bacillota bacterium]
MTLKKENNVIKLSGRVDSGNAKLFEEELIAAVGENTDKVTLDAEELEYISSAGLRVFLKLKKRINGDVNVINVSGEIYDIFEVTGFSSLLNVKKALREFSVDGLEQIGVGGTAKVYRIDEDKIIKVFNKNVILPMIEKEGKMAKAAFVLGVPTAISYDMVKVGDGYGVIYEMLKADDIIHYILKDPENTDKYIDIFADFVKKVHTIEVDSPDFLPVKDTRLMGIKAAMGKGVIPDDVLEKAAEIVESIPDRNTFIHSDCHIGNLMMQSDGELMFIDMASCGKGHPIFDMGSMYLVYNFFGTNGYEFSAKDMLHGFTREQSKHIWDRFIRNYLGTDDEEFIALAQEQIGAVVGSTVILAVLHMPGVFSDEAVVALQKLVTDYYSKGIREICF